MSIETKRTPSEVCETPRGFFYYLGWLLSAISVQPFAYVVANHTCQYRDKESDNIAHRDPPPSCWKESTADSLYHKISAYSSKFPPFPLLLR